jgi:hypothetical protein
VWQVQPKNSSLFFQILWDGCVLFHQTFFCRMTSTSDGMCRTLGKTDGVRQTSSRGVMGTIPEPIDGAK